MQIFLLIRFIVQAFNSKGAGPSSTDITTETFSNGKLLNNIYI